MQVSQMDDHITHAVLGQQEVISMGVSDSAALMHILSSTLYTHPRLATVREVICNGWDAHIDNNLTDIPLKITVTKTQLTVQDFGKGIPHDMIGRIYGVYGDSTKRDDNRSTGGFGLGSKAPFAYTDNFEVVSCHEGVKTIYRVSKSSMEKGGKPSINKIMSLPTEETGITVSFAIQEGHQAAFLELVEEVLVLGEIKASINEGTVVDTLPLAASPTGYIITSAEGTLLQYINLRYGNVVYPIPFKEEYGEQFRAVKKTIGTMWANAKVIFMAEPDSVSIAPSREALILTDSTIATIAALLDKFDVKAAHRSVDVAYREIVQAAVNKEIAAEVVPVKISDIVKRGRIDGLNRPGAEHFTGPYAYTGRQATLNHMLSYVTEENYREDVVRKRVVKAIQNKIVDYKFGRAILKASNNKLKFAGHYRYFTGLVAVVHRFVTYPLYQLMKSNPKLSKERLFYAQGNGSRHNSTELVRPKEIKIYSKEHAYAYLFKRVLLVRSKKAAEDFLYTERWHRGMNNDGYVVYVVTGNPATKQGIKEAFESLSFEVTDNAPDRAKPLKQEVDPLAPPKPKVVKPKRKGFPTLAQSYNKVTENFLLSTARESKEEGITDPMAYAILRNRAATFRNGPKGFGDFNGKESRIINILWGNKIAVVTQVQADALKMRGIRDISDFVYQHVDETLSAKPDFKRYLAFARHAEPSNNYMHERETTVMFRMVKHEPLMRSLGLRFSLSAETVMLLTFFDEDEDDNNTPKCKALMEKVKPSPKYDEVLKKFLASPWAKFTNLKEVERALHCNLPDSEEVAIPYEIIRNILK